MRRHQLCGAAIHGCASTQEEVDLITNSRRNYGNQRLMLKTLFGTANDIGPCRDFFSVRIILSTHHSHCVSFLLRIKGQARQLGTTGFGLRGKENTVEAASTSNGSGLRCDAADLE